MKYINPKHYDISVSKSKVVESTRSHLMHLGEELNYFPRYYKLTGDNSVLQESSKNIIKILGSEDHWGNKFPASLTLKVSNSQIRRALEVTQLLSLTSVHNLTISDLDTNVTDDAIYNMGAPALFILLLHYTSKPILTNTSKDLLIYRVFLAAGLPYQENFNYRAYLTNREVEYKFNGLIYKISQVIEDLPDLLDSLS